MEPHETHHAPVKKQPNISIPAAIVTGAAIIGIAIMLAVSPKGTAPTKQQAANENTGQPTSVAADVTVVRPSDYISGNTNADVVVIEYSDSDCPYCQQFHTTMKDTVAAYNGKVAWVYRFFPLTTLHPNAYTEAKALACVGELAGQTAFWDYLDTVMNVTLAPNDEKSSEALVTFATSAGVNANLFRTCMKSTDTKRIDDDIAEAKKIGARGTPFSVAVNTKTGKQVVIPGAVQLEYMKQTIDSLLKH